MDYGEAPGRPGGSGEVGMGAEWGGEGGPFIGARKEGYRGLKARIDGSPAICHDERERGLREEERKVTSPRRRAGADMWDPHVSGRREKKKRGRGCLRGSWAELAGLAQLGWLGWPSYFFD